MSEKIEIHKNIMSFLDDYLANTPKDVIQQEIKEISVKKFTGVTASNYFANFHKYHLNPENNIPSNVFKEKNEVFSNVFLKNISVTSAIGDISSEKKYFHSKKRTKYSRRRKTHFNTFIEVSSVENVKRQKYYGHI